MESDANVSRICSIECDKCPSATPGIYAPTTCRVLNSVIDAYDAQKRYWEKKIKIDEEALSRLDDLLARGTDIEKRLDSAEKELEELRRIAQGNGG